MKPSVIPNDNNNENNSQRINTNSTPYNVNIPVENVSHNYGRSGQEQNPNSRGPYPHFQQGFGFSPDIHDYFGDSGMRSRLPRMRDHFTFPSNTDEFFPGFGHMAGSRRPRANPQTTDDDGFFSSFPDEFRQYIPEGFGFQPQQRNTNEKTVGSPRCTRPNQNEPHLPNMHQQTPYYHHQQPNVYYMPAAPQSPKPDVCDAAIQTEDLASESADVFPTNTSPKLQQHGLRNTVDMGQKSLPEEKTRGPRSQSAPPNNKDEQFVSQKKQQSQQQNEPQSETAPLFVSKATFKKSSPPKKQSPPLRTPGIPQHSPPHPPVRHSSIPKQQQEPSASKAPTTPGGSHIRTVPMFVEGRRDPIINSHKNIPNQDPPQPAHRPTINTQQANAPVQTLNENTDVPQTPHTADCINKITDIQRDVLDLMTQVEGFKGRKNDKEYMYLDEMLTRNLLKLDTIDTNGKESIRLARKEAIKCIQASINVLEAKSGENAKAAENSKSADNIGSANEQMSDNALFDQQVKDSIDENPNVLNEQAIIPLPPPPEYQTENESLESQRQSVIALPPPPTLPELKETISTSVSTDLETQEQSLDDNSAPKSETSVERENITEKKESSPDTISPTKEVKVGAKKKLIKKIKKITHKDPKDKDESSVTEEIEE